MSIFSLYPKFNFKVDEYDFVRAIDITNSLRIKNFIKEYQGIRYFPYVIKDGERPDNVSYKFYNDPSYDWVILLVNDIYNIYDEWPKDSTAFKNYIQEKYGSIQNALSEVKYYYDENKNIIDLTTYSSLPPGRRSLERVYEYEQRLNTQKSIIKVVNPNIIGSLQSDLNNINIKPAL